MTWPDAPPGVRGVKGGPDTHPGRHTNQTRSPAQPFAAARVAPGDDGEHRLCAWLAGDLAAATYAHGIADGFAAATLDAVTETLPGVVLDAAFARAEQLARAEERAYRDGAP